MKNQRVQFKFDIEKDLFNIWSAVNGNDSYGYNFKKSLPQELTDICKKKDFKKCKKILLKKREKFYQHILIKDIKKYLQNSWSKIEKEYFKRLKKLTGEKFEFDRVDAFLTTIPKCPYNSNKGWFMVAIFGGIPSGLLICGHELMHLHLHNSSWWKKVEDQLGYDKTHDLKEALTELLNLEFRDLFLSKDRRYPNHEKLREYIFKQWKKKKDFNVLTNKCILWIKRNGIK